MRWASRGCGSCPVSASSYQRPRMAQSRSARTVMATCTLLAAFSLARTRDRWALTVASLMYSRPAMSALNRPQLTWVATSRSHSVSARSSNLRALTRS